MCAAHDKYARQAVNAGKRTAQEKSKMAFRQTQPDSVTVLIDNANWAWPQAVAEIFQPRGINALVAQSPADTVRLVTTNKIHLAILDLQPQPLSTTAAATDRTATTDHAAGIQMLRSIRNHDRLLPCILLAGQVDTRLLAQALGLGAFSVMAKPVDLHLLAEQIDRLFVKYYNSNVFSTKPPRTTRPPRPQA